MSYGWWVSGGEDVDCLSDMIPQRRRRGHVREASSILEE